MYDSDDDGLCDGDSNLKKIRIWIFKNAEAGVFWKVQKEFKCGCGDRGLWGAVFITKMLQL